jgi:hypothetical protein
MDTVRSSAQRLMSNPVATWAVAIVRLDGRENHVLSIIALVALARERGLATWPLLQCKTVSEL